MAGRGRIYQRGIIYYIAYRWDGREYRESARSSEVADAERLLATRLRERQGQARSGALAVQAAKRAGKTVDEAAVDLQLSEKYTDYGMEHATANVRAIYDELER